MQSSRCFPFLFSMPSINYLVPLIFQLSNYSINGSCLYFWLIDENWSRSISFCCMFDNWNVKNFVSFSLLWKRCRLRRDECIVDTQHLAILTYLCHNMAFEWRRAKSRRSRFHQKQFSHHSSAESAFNFRQNNFTTQARGTDSKTLLLATSDGKYLRSIFEQTNKRGFRPTR